MSSHFKVIANRRAGSILERGWPRFESELHTAFHAGGFTCEILGARHGEMADLVQNALAEGSTLVLAGGDGTVSALLPALARAGRPFGLIPLGTVNLLGRDLGLAGDMAASVGALARGPVRKVSLARLNDRLFHSNAGLGILGTMARERERARRTFPFSRLLAFGWAALRTLFLARTIEVSLETGGRRQILRADAVLVTNNRFEGIPWRRARLDEAVLECHLLMAPRLRDRFGMVVAVLRGKWREHPALVSLLSREIVITRRDRHRSSVTIDGELERMSGALRFAVAEETLAVYTAAPPA